MECISTEISCMTRIVNGILSVSWCKTMMYDVHCSISSSGGLPGAEQDR